jgi:hypothetical protein
LDHVIRLAATDVMRQDTQKHRATRGRYDDNALPRDRCAPPRYGPSTR